MATNRFIVYACPVGELNRQIELYLQQSQESCGKNRAHFYMPHCTLTGFFVDEASAIPLYLQALEYAYNQSKQENINLAVRLRALIFHPDWHGLEIDAPGLPKLIETFMKLADSPTRSQDIRPKEWLHLSFAYEFDKKYRETLIQLAEAIDPFAPVTWELRFYQRHEDESWTCHGSHSL
ncbi:MAG: hypothetical protein J7647_23630 [Cyanobacteria bacterium SBLK]|nr:hypothetical protein [Cyanobacteria bacterium SBLK]